MQGLWSKRAEQRSYRVGEATAREEIAEGGLSFEKEQGLEKCWVGREGVLKAAIQKRFEKVQKHSARQFI